MTRTRLLLTSLSVLTFDSSLAVSTSELCDILGLVIMRHDPGV